MTTSYFDQENGEFRVIVNHEEQYSLWPQWKTIPGGWQDLGIEGDKKVCLDYIEKNWTDMRPLSLRKWMDDEGSKTLN